MGLRYNSSRVRHDLSKAVERLEAVLLHDVSDAYSVIGDINPNVSRLCPGARPWIGRIPGGAARGEFGTRSRFGVVPERAPLDSYSRDDIEGPNGPQMREPTPSGLRPTGGARWSP